MGAQNGKICVTEEQLDTFIKSSGMEKEKVKEQCQVFCKTHPKGRMNKNEFADFAKIALKNTKKIDMKGMAEHIFRMYDTDQDGYVTFIEFMVVYNIMVNGNAEENLGKIFLIFDVNNDGIISEEEMNVLVKHICVMIEGPDEFERSKDIANMAFKEMDKDKNGEVTKEEFILAVLEPEKVSKFLALKVIDIFV
eukprot:GFUD01015903.1.p1 GENE.GFUD01015903.1~~GFUD01015903.1.p1  ORF type:complete len:194 (+),score=72.25 GFUD01015903.1:100-681(+)